MSDEQKPRIAATVSRMAELVRRRAQRFREESGRLERQVIELEAAAETIEQLTDAQWRSAALAAGYAAEPLDAERQR